MEKVYNVKYDTMIRNVAGGDRATAKNFSQASYKLSTGILNTNSVDYIIAENEAWTTALSNNGSLKFDSYSFTYAPVTYTTANASGYIEAKIGAFGLLSYSINYVNDPNNAASMPQTSTSGTRYYTFDDFNVSALPEVKPGGAIVADGDGAKLAADGYTYEFNYAKSYTYTVSGTTSVSAKTQYIDHLTITANFIAFYISCFKKCCPLHYQMCD